MNADWKLPKSPKLKSKTLAAMLHDNGDRFGSANFAFPISVISVYQW
jgi:hypothetical protein